MNTPREWWVYVYPEDPGGQRLFVGDEDCVESSNYPRRRVRLIEWKEDAQAIIDVCPNCKTNLIDVIRLATGEQLQLKCGTCGHEYTTN